ncbi:MAG: hypothetical protein N2484_12385 [Clostridia bacterium]|nr:hypothetical protein [Clostridia bacterium]
MRMKMGLYIGFFVIFTIVFTQIAFPVSIKVTDIRVSPAENEEHVNVFKDLQGKAGQIRNDSNYNFLNKYTVLEDIRDYHFAEYLMEVESTSLIPLELQYARIEAGEKYKDRILVQKNDSIGEKVSTSGAEAKKLQLLINTSEMAESDIQAMMKDIEVHIGWKSMFGWERENKAYLTKVY